LTEKDIYLPNQTTTTMKTTINQQEKIFWKGKLCKMIKWETIDYGRKIKIKIDKKFIEVDISELSN
jgi:hypothetical protein